MRALAEREWSATGGGVRNLHARHIEFGVDACLTVVDNMAARWIGDDDMEFYFRPSTLFRPIHFDEYLNARRMRQPASDDHHMVQFRISCQACPASWVRTVVVPKATRFESLVWNRKTTEEAFASATDGGGVQCGCDANLVVAPVP